VRPDFFPGAISVQSEVYFLIQNAQMLFIPLLAARFDVAPKSLLKLFVAAIFAHYLMVACNFWCRRHTLGF